MALFLFITYAIAVAFVSLLPAGSSAIEPWDKLFHLLVYLVFALLGAGVANKMQSYMALCIGIIFYSGLLEIAQSFSPGRVMSAYDLLANALGVTLAAVIVRRRLATSQVKDPS